MIRDFVPHFVLHNQFDQSIEAVFSWRGGVHKTNPVAVRAVRECNMRMTSSAIIELADSFTPVQRWELPDFMLNPEK